MAALVEGQRYGLSSHATTSADKTVVLVKLTDSALRTIEEFQKIKNGTSRRPTIKFSGSHGVVFVPIKKSSDNPEGLKPFQFSLSSCQMDQKGSLDCIQQSVRSASQQLELLGSMTHKMQFQATDDVYQTTREKMTLAEEESKKVCAKEIKPSGRNIGRRIKKVIKPDALKLPTPPSSHSSIPHHAHHPKPSSIHKPVVSSNSSAYSQHSSHGNHVRSVSHHNASTTSTTTTTSSPTSKSHSHSPSSTNGISKPTASTNHVNPSGGSRNGFNPAVINLPYRERLIHLLALRPYKKPELLARLQKDGIKEKDKNSLSVTLQQVATFNPRDNSYTLSKHLYADVRPDWPIYTDDDRALLKRRTPQEVANSVSNTPSPAQSPCYSNSSQGSPTSSQKRPSSSSEPQYQPNKKQRIAHSRSKSKPASTEVTVPETSPEKVKVDSSRHVKMDSSRHAKVDSSRHAKVDSSRDMKVDSSKSRTAEIIKREATTTTPDSNHNQISSQENVSPDLASSTSDTPDYVLKYVTLTELEVRQQYKADFNAEYDEYREVHANVESVTKRFRELDRQLKEAQENSEQYENIKNKILTEYKTLKKDPKFVEKKKRCEYLHRKLAHIKKLILEYDQIHYS